MAKHLAVVLTTTENGTNLTPANSPYFIGTTMHQAQTGDMVAIDTGTFIL
ncbi:MAG: hypothetical protein NZZ41_07225 [Candidatus Dojkabacteria bacterium]|nr:hypothetical protein [Candidatus Dojkabacteria bacterium]